MYYDALLGEEVASGEGILGEARGRVKKGLDRLAGQVVCAKEIFKPKSHPESLPVLRGGFAPLRGGFAQKLLAAIRFVVSRAWAQAVVYLFTSRANREFLWIARGDPDLSAERAKRCASYRGFNNFLFAYVVGKPLVVTIAMRKRRGALYFLLESASATKADFKRHGDILFQMSEAASHVSEAASHVSEAASHVSEAASHVSEAASHVRREQVRGERA